MKNYLLILAGAVLLAGCGEEADVATAPNPQPTVETTPVATADQTSGSFSVDARSAKGTQFQNTSPQDATFEFTASGLWSFAKDAGTLSPTGAGTLADGSYPLPGARSFSLIAKGQDGYVYVGDKGQITIKSGTSVYFLMNDVANGIGDNRGAVTVSWSKKP